MGTPESGRGALRVTLAVLAVFLGVAVPLPVLPGAVRSLGHGPTVLGLALGVFPFAAVAGRLVAGRCCDTRGRRWTLRLGIGFTAAAGAAFLLPVSLASLVTARLLQGLGDALVYTAAATYIIDRTPEARRPQALSLLGSGVWGGYAIGPVVGSSLGGTRAAGVVVLAAAVAAVAFLLRLPDPVAGSGREPGLRGLLPRGVTGPGIALGLGNLGYAAVVGFLVLHLDAHGARGAVALTVFSVSVLTGRLVVVPLAARRGLLRTLPGGLVAMALGLLALSQAHGTVTGSVAAAVIGFGYCLPFPALASLVAGRVDAHQRGAAVGALTAFYDVFVGVGSLVFGVIADHWGPASVFVVAAAGVLASAAIDLSLVRREGSAAVALADTAPDV